MSYLTYALLTEDVDFGRRSRSCLTQTSYAMMLDKKQPKNVIALSHALLKQEAGPTSTMLHGICAGPNFAEKVDNGDGTVDTTKINDAEMLTQCQHIYPDVAALYFDTQGAPIPADASIPD